MKNNSKRYQSTQPDLYQTITDQVISAIEAGTDKFELPWHRVGPNLSLPMNIATTNAYQGINILFLWSTTIDRSFPENRWGTYRQWKSVGAQVRKGEKATGIVFCKPMPSIDEKKKSAEPEEAVRWMTKRAAVFNLAQTEGYEPPQQDLTDKVDPVEAADELVKRVGANVREGEDRAYYSIGRDEIVLPLRGQFTANEHSSETEAYYSVLFHELIHWTGHASRLNRDFAKFGEKVYAREELVAELGSAFLCAELGISLTAKPENAAYCESWLKILKNDKTAIAKAATQATQAVRYLRDM